MSPSASTSYAPRAFPGRLKGLLSTASEGHGTLHLLGMLVAALACMSGGD